MGTPHVYDTAENLVKSVMLLSCVTEYMNDKTYPLQVAGLSYGIDINYDGITLSFGGYKDRLPDLIALVAGNITDCKLDPARFAVLKHRQMQFWTAPPLNASRIALDSLVGAVSATDYNRVQKAAILERLSLEDIRDHGQKIFKHVKITGLSHGNWNDRDVHQAVDTLLEKTRSQPLSEPLTKKASKTPLMPHETALLSLDSKSNNNALVYALQAGPLDQKRLAMMTLIRQITEPDFKLQIRDKQQSGYFAHLLINRIGDDIYLGPAIQTADYGPAELQKRAEKWMTSMPKLIEGISDAEFANFRKNLANLSRQGIDGISARHNQLFDLISDKNADFEYNEKSAKLIEALTKEEIVAAARDLVTNNPSGRLIVHTRAENLTEPVPANAYRSVEEFRNRVISAPPAAKPHPVPTLSN